MSENTKLPSYITDKRKVESHDSTTGITLETVQRDANNPNMFSISEEEAAKIRAMAVTNTENGGNLSPEMQQAMGMVNNNDYDKLVSKELHNSICYDEMKRNNIKYKQESEEFTDSIIHDAATKEILDEAEATTKLSNFDFGDISVYLKELEELSFLEWVSYKKKIDEEILRWKSCASMIKGISDLKLDDNVNRELMKINALEQYNFMETIEDFESNYSVNMDKLEKISTKLVQLINSNKDKMSSTSFLTEEMIHLISTKINKLKPEDLNYQYNKDRLNFVVEAFSNRKDLTFLKYKLDNYLVSNKTNIRREFRDNVKTLNGNKKTKSINDIIRLFSDDIAYELFFTLKEIFKGDIEVVYLMFKFIAKIMNSEKKSGKNIWGKVFVLNISDIYNGIFDIDENGEYTKDIYDNFYTTIREFIDSQKIREKINQNVTFGLKVVEKKVSEEIPQIVSDVMNEN